MRTNADSCSIYFDRRGEHTGVTGKYLQVPSTLLFLYTRRQMWEFPCKCPQKWHKTMLSLDQITAIICDFDTSPIKRSYLVNNL